MTRKPSGVREAKQKRITRFDYAEAKEPRTPETGHTSLIGDEQVVTLPLDGQDWSKSLKLATAAAARAVRRVHRNPRSASPTRVVLAQSALRMVAAFLRSIPRTTLSAVDRRLLEWISP
jgi:hypothetical protein